MGTSSWLWHPTQEYTCIFLPPEEYSCSTRMGLLHLEHTLDWPIMGPLELLPSRLYTPCGNLLSVMCVGAGCIALALPLIPQQLGIMVDEISILGKVYLYHPEVVGLPTSKRDLYNPPPLDRGQALEFCKKWGYPSASIPRGWGNTISPILLGMHLEIEGTYISLDHTPTLVQYLLWNGGDTLLSLLLHLARARPPEIPRRTFFWYLRKYGVSSTTLQKLPYMHSNAKGNWVWLLPEIRYSLGTVDDLLLDWYRLAYMRARTPTCY
jgi:hypothetical protein